ncbi:MAG: Gfo/Idh/MocA family oxidoreductase [Proteobacteria bacterium]|nr:Gfo/Idh/MocA family oxidoreductase [Pseudomonadota bacterium]
MIKLGLVGAGRWGSRLIDALARHRRLELAALCRTHVEAGPRLEPSVVVTSDWRSLLTVPGLDGVVIATPPHLHAQITAAALERGIAVLVEKPFALDVDTVLHASQLLGRLGGTLLVDYIHLFSPAFQALKERVPAAAVTGVVSEGFNHGPFRHDYSPLWDYGPHDVAMCLDLMGVQPLHVGSVWQRGAAESGLGAGMYSVDLEFPGGVLAHITVGNTAARKARRFAVATADGWWVVDDLKSDQLVFHPHGGGVATVVALAATQPLDLVLDAFAEGIQGRVDRRFGLDLTQRVTEVLSAAAANVAALSLRHSLRAHVEPP